MTRYLFMAAVIAVLAAMLTFGTYAVNVPDTNNTDNDLTWEDIALTHNTSATALSGGTADDPIVVTIDGSKTQSKTVYIGASGKSTHVVLKGINNAALTAGASFKSGTMLYVQGGAHVDIIGVTIDAAAYDSSAHKLVKSGANIRCLMVDSASTVVNLDGGTVLKGGYRTAANGGAGAAVYGTLNMYNSTVTSCGSGAVAMVGTVNPTLNMFNGSSISYNDNSIAYGAGGILIYTKESAVNMYGGEIAYNTSNKTSGTTTWGGGGVLVRQGVFNMYGGSITGNTTSQSGGGIFLTRNTSGQIGEAHLYGGSITNNTAANGTNSSYTASSTSIGGVHIVNSADVSFTLSDAVVIENNTVGENNANISSIGTAVNYTAITVWDELADVWTENTDYTGNAHFTNADKVIIKVAADITLASSRIRIPSGKTIPFIIQSIEGETHTIYGGSTSGYMCEVFNSQNLTLKNIIWDAGALTWNEDGSYTTGDISRRAFYVNAATLTLNAGTVLKNAYSTSAGGCISAGNTAAVININEGAVIENCVGAGHGGAIYTVGTVNINGGIIRNCVNTNSSSGGGAVYIGSAGKANMYSGELSNCTAVNNGGAVYVISNGEFEMSGGTIKNNNAAFGAVYAFGSVILHDGSIENNTASGTAGGIFIRGANASLNMSGGSITGNTASSNAGVYITDGAQMNVSGNANIVGNSTTDEKESNIYNDDGTLTLTGNLNTGKKIGITMRTQFLAAAGEDVTTAEGITVDENTDSSKKATLWEGNIILSSGETMALTIAAAQNGNTVETINTINNFPIPAIDTPEGFTFIGFVKVSGFGTEAAAVEKIYQPGEPNDFTGDTTLYALWIKVETLTDAVVSMNGNIGLRFISNVNSVALENAGIHVKSAASSGNGFARGTVMATTSFDISGELNKQSGEDVKLNNNTWESSGYFELTGKELPQGYDSFSAVFEYGNSDNYNRAVAYRGYVDITIGDQTFTVYADFKSPGFLTDGDSVSYGEVHARSARQIVRALYFGSGSTPQTVAQAVGSGNYNTALSVSGLAWNENNEKWENTNTQTATQEQLEYYLRPTDIGGDVTAAENMLHVGIFGDSIVAAHNTLDIVVDMAALDGKKITFDAVTYLNSGVSGSYSLYELFRVNSLQTDFVDIDGNILSDPTISDLVWGASTNSSGIQKAMERAADDPFDYFIIQSNRDSVFSGGSKRVAMEELALKRLVYELKINSPNVQIIIMTSPSFGENDFRLQNNSSAYGATPAAHLAKINTVAESMRAAVNAQLWDVGGMWAAFEEQDTGIALRKTETRSNSTPLTIERHPTMTGSYFTGCLIYQYLFNRYGCGMPVYARITQSEAEQIQSIACLLAGVDPGSVMHTSQALRYTQVADGKYASQINNTKPQWFDGFVANAMAYYWRKDLVQYDQRNINKLARPSYVDPTHNGTIAYRQQRKYISWVGALKNPEQATPQSIMFTDCSAWVAAMYWETFGYNIGAYTVADMRKAYDTSIRQSNGMAPYSWVPEGQSGAKLIVNGTALSSKDKATAKQKFIETLKPGDIILSIHPNSAGAHVLLYMGDGIVMHSSSASAAAPGSDYRTEANQDLFELNSGIRVDDISILLDEIDSRYLFNEEAVMILRPSADSSFTGTYTQNTQARLDGLLGIVAYKQTTAAEGITVNTGDSVTFSFTAKNLTPYARNITFTDTIPSGLTFQSSNAMTANSSTVSYTGIIEPYSSITVSYTVSVTASNNTEIAGGSAMANGVRLNFTPISVRTTLTQAQQNSIASFVAANSADYSDAYALAFAAYGSIGKTLTYETAAEVKAAMFSRVEDDVWAESGKYYSTHYLQSAVNGTVAALKQNCPMLILTSRAGEASGTMPTITVALAGGQNLNNRMRNSGLLFKSDLYPHDLIAGDMLIYVEQDRSAPYDTKEAAMAAIDSKPVKTALYLGNGRFATYEDGVYKEVSGSAALELTEGMLGQYLYCAIRPSQAF